MTTLRLESGVCISTDNESIIQQYLKYGAVEVENKPVETITLEETKSRKSKK